VTESYSKVPTADLDLDERLDEALDETFPASDPVAVHAPKPESPNDNPKPAKSHAFRRDAGCESTIFPVVVVACACAVSRRKFPFRLCAIRPTVTST